MTSRQERLQLRQAFERHLSGGPWRRCCVSSRFDPHGVLLPSPGATLCAWLRQRASVALQLCRRRLLGLENDWRRLFELDTTAVDVLCQLLPEDPKDEPQAT